MSYRLAHQSVDKARWYEHGVYAEGSYASWVWRRQQHALLALLTEHFPQGGVRLLDFACGTGRILAFLAPHVAEATGVDIAADMLEYAAGKVGGATLVHGDVTREPDLVPGPFDLVTAFRFFLNAEESLRHEALDALVPRLAPDGLLVFNIHGNIASTRTPAYLVRKYARREAIYALSYGDVRTMLAAHGLEIVSYRGISFLPQRPFALLGEERVERIETTLERAPLAQRLAIDMLFVARRV